MAASRSPFHIAHLFELAAARPRQTVIHLDKPLDIAPEAGTVLKITALAAMVSEAAAWLHAAGLRRGDRLAIVKDNHLDMFLIAAAAARIGALPVLISSANSTEVIRVLTGRIGPRVLVAGTGTLARAAAAGADLVDPGVAVVAVGEAADVLPRGALTIDDLRGAAPPSARPSSDDEPMIVTHTSGTTGLPKLVVHSARTAIRRVPPRMERSRLFPLMSTRPRDVVAGALPFAHIRSVCWVASQVTVAPRALVVMSDPSLANVETMLDAHRPTYLETMPNVFQRWEELADLRPELFARVRLFISTFDAIHPRTVRKFMTASDARFPIWGAALAQSESAASIASIVTRGMARRRRGIRPETVSAGWPTLVRAKVVDPSTGRKCPRRKPGLLMVSTKARCLTYLGEEERFKAKVEGKWWNTGDLAESLGFGRFRMLDREVDMIPGMSCIELESVLLDRLDKASEVIVLSVPDGLPLPILCMRGNRLDAAEWQQATRDLPDLGEPRLMSWEEMPRTGTSKVRRAELRESLLGSKAGIGSGIWT
jgi:acyl-coenzyme A synthetase/AMP-(fatty) acid ligase